MRGIISKEDALAALKKEYLPGECIMCKAIKNNQYIISSDDHAVAFLSAYPRFWGHIIVASRIHKERFSDLTKDEHNSIQQHVFELTKILEKELKPIRCYVASLGSEQNLINTCPHIHFNIIPLYDKDLKPSEVLTWEKGLHSGTKTEWESLYKSIKLRKTTF